MCRSDDLFSTTRQFDVFSKKVEESEVGVCEYPLSSVLRGVDNCFYFQSNFLKFINRSFVLVVGSDEFDVLGGAVQFDSGFNPPEGPELLLVDQYK